MNGHTTREDRQTCRNPILRSFIQIAWRWSSRRSWTPTAPFSSAHRHLAFSNSGRQTQTRFAGAWADDEFLSVPVPKPRFGLIAGRAINGLPPG